MFAGQPAHERDPALGTLEAGFADFARIAVERRRLLYRDYVGATVTKITPLLLRWCGLEGLDLDELVDRLGPDRPWTPWLCGPRPTDPAKPVKGKASLRKPTRGEVAFHDLQHFAYSGVILRPKSKPRGFGIRVLQDCLEMAAFLGNARLRTFGVEGAVTLPGELPATVAAALPGQPLDRLVQHPLLEGAGCVATRVDEPTPWGSKIHFQVAPRWWRPSWARGAESSWPGTGLDGPLGLTEAR